MVSANINAVDHFNIIGGGMYKVELCIYLEEE